MEYFARLSRIVKAPSNKSLKPAKDDQLADFHRSWSAIKTSLNSAQEKSKFANRNVRSTELPKQLHTLLDALVFESARTESNSAPPVLEYLLKNDVLSQLVKLADPDIPRGLKGEVIKLFSSLMVLCDETFVVHSAVHRPLASLLQSCITPEYSIKPKGSIDGDDSNLPASPGGWISSDSEYEEDLADLMCHVCSRIRSHPELLPIFFHEKQSKSISLSTTTTKTNTIYNNNQVSSSSSSFFSSRPSSPSSSISSGRTSILQRQRESKPEYELLIFSYLLRYVHREGRVGDFARAGLLFLVDVAASVSTSTLSSLNPLPDLSNQPQANSSSSSAAEQEPTTAENSVDSLIKTLGSYLLESDFADVVGAGLGALYGVLPSKLVIRPDLARTTADSADDEDNTYGMVLGGMGDLAEDGVPRLPTRDEEDKIIERLNQQGVGVSSSDEFKKSLDLFLRLVDFTQDVLRKASTTSVNKHHASSTTALSFMSSLSESILSSVKLIFLENVVHPSILECSETDGSAVAVMTYIDALLRAVYDGDSNLARTIVRFLLADDDDEQQSPLTSNKRSTKSVVQKRKSNALILLESAAQNPPSSPKFATNNIASQRKYTSPYHSSSNRFSLKDMLVQHIDSTHSSAATAALNLLTTLLTFNDSETLSLLDVVPDPLATCFPTASAPLSSPNYHRFTPEHTIEGDQNVNGVNDVDEDNEETFIYTAKKEEGDDDDDNTDSEEEFVYRDSDAAAGTTEVTTNVAMQSANSLLITGPKKKKTPARLQRKKHSGPTFAQLMAKNSKDIASLLSIITPITSYTPFSAGGPTSAKSLSLLRFAHQDSKSTGYARYLDDAEKLLARDPAFQRGLMIPNTSVESFSSIMSGEDDIVLHGGMVEQQQPQVIKHALDENSSLLVSLLIHSLAQFFSHSPEHNLALTGTIATLALCPRRSLEGWLLRTQKMFSGYTETPPPEIKKDEGKKINSHAVFESPAESDDGDDRSIDYEDDDDDEDGEDSENKDDVFDFDALASVFGEIDGVEYMDGTVFAVLRDLASKLDVYRKDIVNFDEYLAERRQGLMFAENLADALDVNDDEFGHETATRQQQQDEENEKNPSSQFPRLQSTASSEQQKPTSRSFSAILMSSPTTGNDIIGPDDSHDYTPPGTPSRQRQLSSTLKSPRTPSNSGTPTYTHARLPSNQGGGLNPFAHHYRKTASIIVIPHMSSKQPTSTPSYLPLSSSYNGISASSTRSSTPFSLSPQTTPIKERMPTSVTLSTVLDNAVILEEAVKELVAIVQVRRSLGIDPIN